MESICKWHQYDTEVVKNIKMLDEACYKSAGMSLFAAMMYIRKRLGYEKWLQDIADSQDVLSGHVQYTAPYIRSGGGPGGWGCAIVEVPYQLYKHYGDPQILKNAELKK